MAAWVAWVSKSGLPERHTKAPASAEVFILEGPESRVIEAVWTTAPP